MEVYWARLCFLTILICGNFINALPTTLLEDAHADEVIIDTNKVKRAHSAERYLSSPNTDSSYFGIMLPSKRGTSLVTGESNLNPEKSEWNQEKKIDSETNSAIHDKQFFHANRNPFEDKSITEYQKGFHYGTNKAKLDEQIKNSILKSEIFGEPAAVNQYRYYGGGNDRRKRRSNLKRNSNSRFTNRLKRDIDLSPEDILTLLSFWEEDRKRQLKDINKWSDLIPTDNQFNDDTAGSENFENEDISIDSPLYSPLGKEINPSRFSEDLPVYSGGYFDVKPYKPKQIFAKRQWVGYSENKMKRFMVSKKRNDPTRELRYLNVPNSDKDDMYSLTQLLDVNPNTPKYFNRMVL